MNTRPVHSFLITVLLASLGLMSPDRASAQTLTVLHSFTYPATGDTNFDGIEPIGGLLLSGSTLYGTTLNGGTIKSTLFIASGDGTVFKLNTDGMNYTIVHTFNAGVGNGAGLWSGLILSGNTLYGTTSIGGSSPDGPVFATEGTVFAVNTDGSGYTNLHSFTLLTEDKDTNSVFYGAYTNSDGASPRAGLLLSGDTLYGTAEQGGVYGNGTVFAVNTDGSGFTTLHSFSPSDGVNPQGGLVLSGNTLYGTAINTVFAVNTDGTGFTNLHNFSYSTDGIQPTCGLILSGNTLYGTTEALGGGNGTVFAVNTDGSGFATLHVFNDFSDGGSPYAGLTLSGNTLYGTTQQGGIYGSGTVFAINTNGSNFAVLHSFNGISANAAGVGTNSDGSRLYGGLVLSGNTLYGTAEQGGIYGEGTVFAITLPGGGGTNCLYSINPTNAVFGASGGSDSVSVTESNGCDWTAVSNDSFITITSGTNGTGNGTVNYSVAANTSTNDLTGTMTIAGQTFTVTESGTTSSGGCTYTLSATNAALAAAGGSDSVTVITSNGCAWTAASNDPSFITIASGSSGSGNGTVHYTVAANTNSSEQVGTMTIAGQTFTVTESGTTSSGGCTFTLSATTVTLPAKGGAKNVKVKAKGTSCLWTAVSNDDFITIIAGASSSGNGTVDYSVSGNTSTTARSGTITIAGETFTVNQAAGGCTYKLSPKSGKLKAVGGTGTIKIKPNFSDCDWTAVSNDPFITVTDGASGTGKGTVTYSAPANATSNVLTGSITVAGQTFTVMEAGAK
jgi:uncharacterized repeat protein (TIGR03803 family)